MSGAPDECRHGFPFGKCCELRAPAVAVSGAAPRGEAATVRHIADTWEMKDSVREEIHRIADRIDAAFAELAALRAERDELAAKLDMLADAADRLEGLMADAARINWLEEHAETIRDRWSLDADENCAFVWDCLDFERNHTPLREAIDAAAARPDDRA